MPRTGLLKVIGKPSKTVIFESDRALPAESVRKLAVKVVLCPSVIVEGLAVCRKTIHGVKFKLPELPGVKTAVSHGGALGPVLQPHQFWAALAVPGLMSLFSPVPSVAVPVLPTMRQ